MRSTKVGLRRHVFFASHVRGLALVRRIGGGRSPRLRFPPTANKAVLLAYIGFLPIKP